MGENQELMQELLKQSKKQSRYGRLTALFTAIFALAVVICLVFVVPPVLKCLKEADKIMLQAEETIVSANEAIAGITEMSGTITNMGNDMDGFVQENSEAVTQAMSKIAAIDFEGLNKAIGDLGAVVEPMAKFFGVFKK